MRNFIGAESACAALPGVSMGALFVSGTWYTPEKRGEGMHQCKSGRHWWLSAESAERCCNSAWRRVLVVQQHGQALPADAESVSSAAGVLYGRQWVKSEVNSLDSLTA